MSCVPTGYLCSVYLPHLTGEITAIIIVVLVVFAVLVTVLVVVVWWSWQNVRCSARVHYFCNNDFKLESQESRTSADKCPGDPTTEHPEMDEASSYTNRLH